MTKLTVAIMVQSLDHGLATAAMAAEVGADLIEFRIDLFTENLDDVTALVERTDLPCIVTCRPTWEGGHYEGSDIDRVPIFEAACRGTGQSAYLDVELIAWQRSSKLRDAIVKLVDHNDQPNPVDTGLILSSHDFETRPADLYQRVEAMASDPFCRVIKLTWLARSLRDNIEAFEIIQRRHKPTIALCMGDAGLPSRVLAGKFGALLTFAAAERNGGTAIGQPLVSELKDLYRWDQINSDTRVYGVIGHPIGHSMSPPIHNAGFNAIDFNGVYLPMPIPPEYEHFKATVSTWLEADGLDFRGASVTIPHKANLLQFVAQHDHPNSHVEPLALEIGAANTLTVRDDGSIHASNTDYAAALDAVCNGLNIERDELKGRRIAVIGAGGAARAIVAGFAHYGATVVVYNRTREKADALADQFNGKTGKVVVARLEKLCDSCCDVFINCTPIGMHPNIDDTPIPTAADTKGWGPETIVFDTIYNPIETRLLREARQAGCVTIPGTEMFVRQAADQFRQWTNNEAPTDVFERVLLERLNQ